MENQIFVFLIAKPINIIKKGTNRYINKAAILWIICDELRFNNSLLQPLSQGKIPVTVVPNP